MSGLDKYLVVALSVEDKFGDSGLTGVAIIEKGSERWRVDSFLLSCRVLGRKVEDTLLAYVVNQAKEGHAKTIIGEFVPTKKNAPAKDFYRNHGFTQHPSTDGVEVWERQLQDSFAFPQFIRVAVK
jgi:FkbH-like protein